MLRSVATMPVRTSVTKMMQSAESMAICACVRIWDKIISFDSGSMPPVSTSENFLFFHSHSPKMRSRVTPGVSSTMERRCPISLLNSVDLPTFGRPTMATIGLDIRFSSFFFPYSAVPKMSLSSPAASLCIL